MTVASERRLNKHLLPSVGNSGASVNAEEDDPPTLDNDDDREPAGTATGDNEPDLEPAREQEND